MLATLALAMAALGCRADVPYACDAAQDCVDGGRVGTCEAEGYCSFPDGDCASGQRYAEHAPDDFAGMCTPPDDDPVDLPRTDDGSTSGSNDGWHGEHASSGSTGDPEVASTGGEATTTDAAPATGESTGGEGSTDTDGGSSGGAAMDCDALDCEACMACATEAGGPCAAEQESCADANGCTSGVVCQDDCILTGLCFEDCCSGGVGAAIDAVVLCQADHCIDACGQYEFRTCG